MQSLNHHHLLYFWTVAREGGVSKAAATLRLSQPTVSAQVRLLEGALGHPLFDRQGRTLVLTDAGRIAYRYAEDIFTAARELQEVLQGCPPGRRRRFTVGVVPGVSTRLVHRLLRPAATAIDGLFLTCRVGRVEQLVGELALHTLDVVISTRPAPTVRGRVFSHLLGESGVTFFAGAPLARQLRRRFPASLGEAPMLVPTLDVALRHPLDQWLAAEQIRPVVVGEFEDAGLFTIAGEGGDVVFPASSAIEREVCRQHRVSAIGRVAALRERYYALSTERRSKHPGVAAMIEAARTGVFAAEVSTPLSRRGPATHARG